MCSFGISHYHHKEKCCLSPTQMRNYGHCKFRETCMVPLFWTWCIQMATSWINAVQSVGYTLQNYEKTQEEYHSILKWKTDNRLWPVHDRIGGRKVYSLNEEVFDAGALWPVSASEISQVSQVKYNISEISWSSALADDVGLCWWDRSTSNISLFPNWKRNLKNRESPLSKTLIIFSALQICVTWKSQSLMLMPYFSVELSVAGVEISAF